MMKKARSLSAALAMSALLVALSGCQKQEGPMEKAGKEVDQAAAIAGEKMEKAGEEVDKAAATVGEKIEKAGESIQDAATADKKY
ncbi:hypothetical protein CEW83_12325 [Parazoarcus communis]|uniref:Uncharacterized protein n=2 Tax=Parazoarcus communis TaxID=41977 RepID=A0A2U8GQH4_9RHOO|nr:hypothetical protein CEW83_12325 [Parazoarcus communis]